MEDLSRLVVGNFVAIDRSFNRINWHEPEKIVLEIFRTTNSFLFCLDSHKNRKYKVNKKTGRISGTYSHVTEATPEIIKTNKEQMEVFLRREKAYAKFLEVLVNKGDHLSLEQLEVLNEAWDRCRELGKI